MWQTWDSIIRPCTRAQNTNSHSIFHHLHLGYKDISNTRYVGLEICATGKWVLQVLLRAHLTLSSYFMNFVDEFPLQSTSLKWLNDLHPSTTATISVCGIVEKGSSTQAVTDYILVEVTFIPIKPSQWASVQCI